ncbi:MAG: adenosylcobalamin-dependent ribonucleoside-diphosphate reductase [Thermoflexus hugenholtzii]|uniref:adenosylcobalamin-dependent ribonucleoside-diphosphate reductase n=1 Tax=Thermoflexus TaxID=1495649 RepID=UPI001C78CAE1|nr:MULTISPECIES: adenosylcobalamin-dependent ribonucleoside-diphosphate reductase [Thermoflexus]QWK10918.1 MAG: adenosylcobalamin-dependent ribonucleoside-diphosphate reductase [Thermoflexus hugenholtzii]
MTTRWEIRVDEANPEEEIPLTENGRIVLERRYLRKGPDGRPVETIPQMFRRVARAIAEAEKELGGDPALWEERFYQLLTSLRFLPNSPTFTGAGTPLGQLAACFVLPLEDDMGKIPGGIFQTLRDAALIQQTGGGNGFSFSRLRPKNAIVFSSMGRATGPVGFLRVYDRAFGEIAQGGSRRGANMAVLRVDHPDIEEFITCKTDENAITNFNISVGITDAFMRAVENDEEWELRFPDVLHPAYRNFRGTLEDAERAGIPIRVYKRVRARDLFRKIATQAHHNGEPGVLFLDTANRSNPVPHLYTLEATNPCGEQWLGPYENCCLGSVNLARHVKYVNGKAEVDWEKLRETVEWATRFLDNVVQVNQYVPAVPQLKEAAFKTRRIGLGFMGLADLMYHLRIRYGSEEGQEFAAQIAEFIRYHAMRTSIELARERGPFPAIRGSIYDPEDLKWEPPKPLKPYTRDWGRPPLDWNAIVEGIRRHGIRNAAQTTVAPTGTLSTVAGCEGYGCEPVFALAYIRYVHEAEGRLELRYVSPLFMRALKEAGLDEETRARIIEEVLRKGTCQHIQELPDWIRHTFVVAQDLTPEEHVWMQASIQAFIDNSISKTINFPETATVEDVEKAYLLAWKLGCKGLTVYVAGSRQKEVLETLETKARKEQKEAAMVPAQPTLPQPVGPTVRPRPQKLAGVTYRIATPVGTAFITLNENGEGQPFEVFLNVGKAGSDIAAVAEAIGRLISLLLRLPSPVPPAERLRQVVDQLQGIGGGRALGFGPERVRSLPDGIARVLAEYLAERGLELPAAPAPAVQPALPLSEPHPGREEPRAMGPVGDICPQCGEATLLEQEGCRTCYNCGYSEC